MWANEMYFLKEMWFLLALVGRSAGVDDRLKLNMLGFTPTPAVSDTEKTNIRGYTLGTDRTDNITLNIKLLVNLDNLSGKPLCDNLDLQFDVTCEVQNIPSAKSTFRIANINNSGYNGEARVGVFTAYAQKFNRSANATIIVHHERASVIPIVRTKTVSIWDSNVTLVVDQRNASIENLRWAKNGNYNIEWDNLTEISLENITLDDAGVYECYINDSWNEGKHAFMHLIVRECPHNKWSPPNCTMDCEVCYNGGVCDTVIGTCICPSGFTGASCKTSSGGNRFGRDGLTPCESGNDDGCKGNLFCPPMPQGCACHAGWKGLSCETECEAGKYGADCLQDCHCNATECQSL
ncbi:angiopoietin-1 receptor-like [Anneissia japonica]|uniref:angiopoietin-1 receptor-like n=1 Tax=Anneissia japonica TaxID=1529436 RepID=UPI001425820C|nr:angiopoietin-1 receptor-like [Anneissia japonica]